MTEGYSITIEDDDGHTTTLDWPTYRLMLAVAVAIHEAAREATDD